MSPSSIRKVQWRKRNPKISNNANTYIASIVVQITLLSRRLWQEYAGLWIQLQAVREGTMRNFSHGLRWPISNYFSRNEGISVQNSVTTSCWSLTSSNQRSCPPTIYITGKGCSNALVFIVSICWPPSQAYFTMHTLRRAVIWLGAMNCGRYARGQVFEC